MTRRKRSPVAAPQVRELALRLRELKDQAGITTTALARKTAYSRSSWTRCLNGTTVPPRYVVATLGALAGMAPNDAEMARLLALWELAEQAHIESRRAEDAQVALAEMTPAVRSRRWFPISVVAAGVIVAVTGVVAWRVVAAQPAAPTLAPVAQTNSCDYSHRDGHWYAGHSTTSTRLVWLGEGAQSEGRQDVVEVQCLLKRHGFDPGRVDGLFGPNTERAVKQQQTAAGIVVDGIVGPHTWAVLRG